MEEKEKHFRVILNINGVVISFIAKSQGEMLDRLGFLYRGINIPETIFYNKDGIPVDIQFNKNIIVIVVDNLLDNYTFRLPDYKEFIEKL